MTETAEIRSAKGLDADEIRALQTLPEVVAWHCTLCGGVVPAGRKGCGCGGTGEASSVWPQAADDSARDPGDGSRLFLAELVQELRSSLTDHERIALDLLPLWPRRDIAQLLRISEDEVGALLARGLEMYEGIVRSRLDEPAHGISAN